MDVCCVKGCKNKSIALGMCDKHWKRTKKYGSPVASRNHTGMFMGKTPEERFFMQVKKTDDCWLWLGGKDNDGYGGFHVLDYKGKRYTKAHRFSYAMHNGEIPDGMVIMHACDNPSCVNPEHLSWGTHKENLDDMRQKGRHLFLKGEQCPVAKLTEEQARAILLDPRPYAAIATDFDTTVGTVSDIKNRHSWKHIDIDVVKGKKTGSKGSKHYSAKLTDDAVREIRTSTESGRILAERFGITPQTICDIRKRRSWAHVTD